MSSTVQPRGPGCLPVLLLAAVPLGTFLYDGPRLAPAGDLLVGLARWVSWAFWLTATLASLVVAQPLGWLLLGFFVLSVHPRRILVARVGFSPRLRDSALVLWRLGGRSVARGGHSRHRCRCARGHPPRRLLGCCAGPPGRCRDRTAGALHSLGVALRGPVAERPRRRGSGVGQDFSRCAWTRRAKMSDASS